MRVVALLGLLLFSFAASAQELFPMTQPASTMPKNVLGIRAFADDYKEPNNQYKNLFGLRLMYGVTSKLSVMLSATVSNHHDTLLPPDFPDHNTPQIGVKLPYQFNGLHAYAQYRFLSIDGEHSHIRAAAYAESSWLNVAHDEAEPNLMDDTKGYGGGFIVTGLKNRFAISATGGFIIPSMYKGDVPDQIAGLPPVPAKVVYGRAVNYSLSLGYLLFPRQYKSYNQTNINLYLEFIGKSYEGARIYFQNIGQPGSYYEITGLITGLGLQALSAGHYVEIHPGVQAIIKSNLRIDLSIGYPFINKSWAHYFYPLYTIGIQRYFFFDRNN